MATSYASPAFTLDHPERFMMVKNTDNHFLIHIYGDSLSLPRNKDGVPFHLTYGELLRTWCEEKYHPRKVHLYNWSRGDATIETQFKEFKRQSFYFSRVNDVLIIQLGICDCAPRPIPPWLKNAIGRSPGFAKKRMVKFIHHNRAKIQKLGIKWQHVVPGIFKDTYVQFLTEALKEFERIYVINIAPTTPAMDAHSPGFQAQIDAYNAIIAKLLNEMGKPNIYLIDINKKIKEHFSEIENYINKNDGHHITALSHRLYAESIWEIEKLR